jgi:DNA-binding MarR family transcriptional regulator
VRATDLSARSGQHKQIIGTIVDELVSLGYVRREPDPADRRAKRIVPTGHGLDEIAKARAILAAIEERLEHALGEQRFASFREVFQEATHLQRGWRQTRNPPA